VSHEQNLVLHACRGLEDRRWSGWRSAGWALPRANSASTDINRCRASTMRLGQAPLIPVAQSISNHFARIGLQHDIGDLEDQDSSGCINACGHHTGHLGTILRRRQERGRALPDQLGWATSIRQDGARHDPRTRVAADKVVGRSMPWSRPISNARGEGERFRPTRIGASAPSLSRIAFYAVV